MSESSIYQHNRKQIEADFNHVTGIFSMSSGVLYKI